MNAATDEGDLAWGLHAVQAVLEREPELIRELWVDNARRDKRCTDILRRAQQAGIAVHQVKRQMLDEMTSGARHQGVAARTVAPVAGDERTLKALLGALQEPALLLVLDGVQDPHNLGACLRTADAVGAHAVIVPRDRACGLTAAVRKVASGAVGAVPFIQVTNLARTLRTLQEAGVWLAGADAAEAAGALYAADLTGPLALVLGAEGTGLRRLTRDTCDLLVRLPMQGRVESLNVSVAAGVCLYEALRQRQGTGSA